MSLLRLIILGFLCYYIIKMFRGFMRILGGSTTRVDGKAKDTKPLDLGGQDVEDADFEDLK